MGFDTSDMNLEKFHFINLYMQLCENDTYSVERDESRRELHVAIPYNRTFWYTCRQVNMHPYSNIVAFEVNCII